MEDKKEAIRELQKTPRKTIRDFVNACNRGKEIDVLKNLADNFIFERRKNWQNITRTEGTAEFKAYLNSPDQRLYGKNFKIRSSWDFSMPTVTIGVKYFPISEVSQIKPIQKFGQIKFNLEDNKIVNIVDES
ncbi:hypothetical protein ACVWYG_002036 [Pedobacter sp. UYEF25]